MIDLLYPPDYQVPLIPAARASKLSKTSRTKKEPSSEYFPVIDSDCVVIGRAERAYCHGGSHVLHPVVHLHIINRKEELYLQKRAEDKEIQPGKWDTSVGGHVVFGEAIMEALFREAGEELSLREFNPIFLESYVWETDRDNEFVNAFLAIGDFELKPDRKEVSEGRWWPIYEIETQLNSNVFTPNFEEEYLRFKHKMLSLL